MYFHIKFGQNTYNYMINKQFSLKLICSHYISSLQLQQLAMAANEVAVYTDIGAYATGRSLSDAFVSLFRR